MSNVPVLQQTIEAYKLWQDYHGHFPRLIKYSLGTKIDLLFTDVIELLLTASYTSAEQKLSVLLQASKKLDLLKFFVQIAWEVKALDHKKYGTISIPLNTIGASLGGWIRDFKLKQPSTER